MGVAHGRNAIIIGNTIKALKLDTKYVGFDTFVGYAQEDMDNKALKDIQRRKVWHTTKEKVEDTISKAGLSDICTLIEGDLKETLPQFLIEHNPEIALLYIDCNAYLPSITGMTATIGHVKRGSIICIDEHRIGGETKALEEFSKTMKHRITKTGDTIGIPAYIKVGG